MRYRAFIFAVDNDGYHVSMTREGNTYKDVRDAIFAIHDNPNITINRVNLHYIPYLGDTTVELYDGSFSDFWAFNLDPIANLAIEIREYQYDLDLLANMVDRMIKGYHELEDNKYAEGAAITAEQILDMIKHRISMH